MNPMQMAQMLQSSSSPKQMAINMIEQSAGQNPFFANLLSLAKCGRGNEIEVIARNIMREKGLDFDKEFGNFRRTFKI